MSKTWQKYPNERIIDGIGKKISLLGIIIFIIVISDIPITMNQPAKPQTHKLQHNPQPMLTHGAPNHPQSRAGREAPSV